MKIIGLTGLTGAGKSTVAKILKEYGCYHIDADSVAKYVINDSEDVKNKLKVCFGQDVINNDGTTNRALLAERAFANKESTEKLNSITHPAVTSEIKNIINQKSNEKYTAFIIDAIALFESGENKICDLTVAVVAPLDIRLERIIARDNITKEKALQRINAQKDENFYNDKVDIIIKNYPPYDIKKQIGKILENL